MWPSGVRIDCRDRLVPHICSVSCQQFRSPNSIGSSQQCIKGFRMLLNIPRRPGSERWVRASGMAVSVFNNIDGCLGRDEISKDVLKIALHERVDQQPFRCSSGKPLLASLIAGWQGRSRL